MEAVRALARPELRHLRWTTPEQWHVTLRFLGEVADPDPVARALHEVSGALRASGEPPVEAVMGPASAWFPGRNILQVPVAGLDALASAVARATAPWGAPPEQPFSGHLTLARTRGRVRGPASLAGAPLAAEWSVPAIELVSSTPGPAGSRYRVEAQVALG
jgi:RNA 2',3'-cyclic 3'-phosphodiesterase